MKFKVVPLDKDRIALRLLRKQQDGSTLLVSETVLTPKAAEQIAEQLLEITRGSKEDRELDDMQDDDLDEEEE